MSIADKLITIAENEPKVFEAGKTAEYNEFWNETHNNTKNGSHAYAGYHWTDNNFKPTRDIVIGYGERIFYATGIVDLRGCLKRQGVVLDTSKSGTMNYALNSTSLKYLPVIDCSGVNRAAGINYCISGCTDLEEVEKIILPDYTKISNYNGFLSGCSKLTKAPLEGVIGKSGFNISGSPNLDLPSAKNILTCLADLTGTENEFAFSVKIAQDVWDRLAEDGTTAPNGLTWEEYVDSKGWLT